MKGRELMIMKRWRTSPFLAFAVAAALGLGLAGCGGSSTPVAAPTPQETCEADGGTWANGACTTAAEALAAKQAAQRTATSNAIDAANTAVTAVSDDSTDAQVSAADTAITAVTNAIAAADDLPAAEKTANTGTVTALTSRLSAAKASRTAAMNQADEDARKAATAMAKALKKAIETVNGIESKPLVTTSNIPVIGTDADSTAAITLKAGDAVASLGGWKGMDYAGTEATGDAKTIGQYRRYSNPAADKSVTFTSEAGEAIHKLTRNSGAPVGDYATPTKADKNIGGSMFPTAGTTTYTGDGRKFSGTYMDAPGIYQCTVTSCTAKAGGTSGITLTGTWTFTPNAGAMLTQKDSEYLYFGWWVRKDKDGPTHAGALYGTIPDDGISGESPAINNSDGALVGKATYMGKAAGKFAISDSLRPTEDDAGHFTADAELMADFKTSNSTLSGTINNFRLNDGSSDPGWSVELQKTMYSANKFKTAGT